MVCLTRVPRSLTKSPRSRRKESTIYLQLALAKAKQAACKTRLCALSLQLHLTVVAAPFKSKSRIFLDRFTPWSRVKPSMPRYQSARQTSRRASTVLLATRFRADRLVVESRSAIQMLVAISTKPSRLTCTVKPSSQRTSCKLQAKRELASSSPSLKSETARHSLRLWGITEHLAAIRAASKLPNLSTMAPDMAQIK